MRIVNEEAPEFADNRRLKLSLNVAGRSLAILSAPAKSAIVRATFKKPKRAKLVFSKSNVQLRMDTDSQSFLPPT